jgi:LPXTG-motif cell wall-anchored protein
MTATSISMRQRAAVFFMLFGMIAAIAPLTFAAPAWGATGTVPASGPFTGGPSEECNALLAVLKAADTLPSSATVAASYKWEETKLDFDNTEGAKNVAPKSGEPAFGAYEYIITKSGNNQYKWFSGADITSALSNHTDPSISHVSGCNFDVPQTDTPVAPGVSFSDPTCESPTPSWSPKTVAGVSYNLTDGTVGPGNTITVSATLAAGHVLESGATGTFTHTFGLTKTDCTVIVEQCPPGTTGTPPNCTPPPPPPPPPPPVVTRSLNVDATEVCVAADLSEVIALTFSNVENVATATLNLTSIDSPAFSRSIELTLSEAPFAPIAWPVDDAGALYANVTATITATGVDATVIELALDTIAEECTIVLDVDPIDEEEPTEEPKEETPEIVEEEEPETAEPTPVTQVRGEVTDAPKMPRTGAPALVLALMGLASMGLGGGLLRRRRS